MDEQLLVLSRHKLSVDDYHRMGVAGILGEEDRVELIEGELLDMAPIGDVHAATVNGLTRALVMACGDNAIVSVQNPVRLDRFNEPQPDLAVLLPRRDNYFGGCPTPVDVVMLLEVADSSLRFDRAVKLPLYARSGVPEVWILDVKRRVVEIFRDPAGAEYCDMQLRGPGDRVSLGKAPGITVTLDRVFG